MSVGDRRDFFKTVAGAAAGMYVVGAAATPWPRHRRAAK